MGNDYSLFNIPGEFSTKGNIEESKRGNITQAFLGEILGKLLDN